MNVYREFTDKENTLALREMLKELPNFCGIFFRGIEPQTTTLTRLSYAYDLRLFFRYVLRECFPEKTMETLTIADLAKIQAVDIEIFLEHITYYVESEKTYINHALGKERKLSTIRTLFKYLFKQELMPSNVAALVDMPKKNEKAIVRMEPDEVARLLDMVDSGEGLTERQQKYQEKTRTRDLAMLMLFLSTGIRVSECVGINLNDVDFESNAFAVTRKGGDRTILYFPDETARALKAYYGERLHVVPYEGHEAALFLSMQRKRMDVRSVEFLVKRYASVVTPLKTITPHKLRSTFGTTLYQETGDIYLVADVLGHNDVNTTRKHYAAVSDENRRRAARKIKLRDDESSQK